ncbi:MAG: hypothetical protein F4X68_09990 [Acidimicrobiia bacterium]|nr:hypothetical protein [bacterium]MXZ77171.1 hypothetical protein [Acidimicrobiia bacterium]MXZ85017.1 hypothetical protein [Acidimicrobiia bacterium]MYB11139.1 hypothetical protein [Acidimicrobiia bacterium]MYB74275.1 hypothetical protein [Acidimicrobiia bacterium]
MTKPTNVLLDPPLRAVAKRRADELGVSVSAYIRELIRSDDAAARAANGDITPLIGILGGGGEPSDVARDKHKMIGEAFGGEFDRRLRSRGGSG